MKSELEPPEVDYGWTIRNDRRIWEYKYLVLQGEPEPKRSHDSSFLRILRPTPRPGPTGISSSGSSYSSVVIRPGVYRRKPAEPSTLRSTKVSSRASRGPRWCKLQTRQRAEAVRSVRKCLHVARSQFVSARDKLKFLLVAYRNTTFICKCTRICYCNIHLFVTHFNQKNSLTRPLHS